MTSTNDTPQSRPNGADPGALAALVARLADLPALARETEMREAVPTVPGLTLRALAGEVKRELRQRRATAEAAMRAGGPPAEGEVRWPFGYALRPDGLFFDGGDDAPPLRLCDAFDVIGEARNPAGEDRALFIGWQDGDGRTHRWAMPLRLTVAEPGILEGELIGRGLRVNADPAARLRLRCALADVRVGGRVLLIARAGWHGGAYAMGDGAVIGAPAEPLVMQRHSEAGAAAVEVAGDLDGWRSGVAALAVGNDLPAFCLAAAFAGPLLDVAGEDGGGFHLFGKSKSGKTTAAQVAVSAWGPPTKAGGLRDWRATANGLEAACAEAGDGLLTLDEIHQADPREVAGAIYAMANGAGKGRMSRELTGRRRSTWRTLILSTGEVDVQTVVERSGRKMPAGAAVRLPSLGIRDADAWPQRHGREDRAAMLAELHAAMRRHHGTAARAYLARLAEARAADPEELHAALAAMRDRFAAKLPADADAQVRHVARFFALVATAGELAAAWDVLPWPGGEAERAALAVMRDWIDRRGGAVAGEDSAAMTTLRAFIAAHGASRFDTILPPPKDGEGEAEVRDQRTINRAGWRERDRGGRWSYFLTSAAWREVFADADPLAAARALAAAGVIRRGDGKNLMVSKMIPGEGKLRLYAVAPGILAEPEGGA
jgi:putative DNA primase/helicase